MPVVRQREAARRDLVEHFVYLAENAGLDVAERFLSRPNRASPISPGSRRSARRSP